MFSGWATAGPPLDHLWATAGPPLDHLWATHKLPFLSHIEISTFSGWATPGPLLGHLWATPGPPIRRQNAYMHWNFNIYRGGPLLGHSWWTCIVRRDITVTRWHCQRITNVISGSLMLFSQYMGKIDVFLVKKHPGPEVRSAAVSEDLFSQNNFRKIQGIKFKIW